VEKIRAIVRFGLFEFDAASGELRKQGRKIRLSDQPTQILALLVASPGEVVTRDAVRQRLWPADTFVDFDAGLNSATKKLRDALGDPAENPQFIETLPRRGYRFIAPVTVTPIDLLPDPPRAESTSTITPSRMRYAWIAGGVALVATVAFVVVAGRGWWPRAAAAPDRIESLAVLPFENLTGDTGRDYLADSLTNALTTSLAQAGGFHVVSSTSAAQYRSAKRSLPAIARELNVDAVLEGSIARSGQDVRVTAQLIDAATDRHIWARTYEGEPSKVLEMHREIARVIAAALQNRFTASSAARADKPRAMSAEASDAYLKGMLAMGRQTPEGFRSAVAYFEQVVAREPDFAQAHVVLAQAQMQLLFAGPLSPREVIPKAEAAVRTALQLDDTLAQAHATLGSILTNFYWKWEEGEREFHRSRQLADRSSDTRTGGGGIESLIRAGRVQDAIAEAEVASNKDPQSFGAHVNVASAYRAAGQHDRAIDRYRRALEIDPASNRVRFQLGITFMRMGRLDDAIGELEAAAAQSRNNPRFLAYLGYAYAAAGRRGDAVTVLAELDARAREQYVSSFGIALIHDALGQREQALAALERAHQDRAVEFSQMSQYPPFTTIASDPRYKAMMQAIGLPR
jgi:TolB-like protein/DNA-binding winged helix-turn-helix (wHTH) protein/Flp pilus assembly protein TadD